MGKYIELVMIEGSKHTLKLENCLVTGGCGFIGSHIVDNLIGYNVEKVSVLDNLSSGNMSNVANHLESTKLNMMVGDLRDMECIKKSLEDIRVIFHIAAYPEVRTGYLNPELHYYENVRNTFHLLEGIRRSSTSQTIIFTSSSTVYGEPEEIPTSENYGPLLPISTYGASKLACEALLSAYSHNYGINCIILRFANIVGSRNRHGIIVDFLKKLHHDSNSLEVLGDGSQSKSYLHIDDCISGIFFCLSNGNNRREIYNVGNDDMISTISVAQIVCNVMNLKNVQMKFKRIDSTPKGWVGDVTKMQLDISKLKRQGWMPGLSSKAAVSLAATTLQKEL